MDCLLEQPMIRLLRTTRKLGQAQDEYRNGLLHKGTYQDDTVRITPSDSCLTGSYMELNGQALEATQWNCKLTDCTRTC